MGIPLYISTHTHLSAYVYTYRLVPDDYVITPRAHAQQGVKQSFCPSVVVVVVVVNTKMARSA